MPCSYPVPTLCPCSRRSDRYDGGAMSGDERERGAASNAPPSWGGGRGTLRDETKRLFA